MRTLWGRLRAFLWDWRTIAMIGGAIVTGLLVANVVRGYANDSRLNSTNGALQRQIKSLQDTANDNAQRIGELTTEISALSNQITQSGETPVVSDHSATTTTTVTRKNATGSPQSPATSTTSTTTPRKTTPSQPTTPTTACTTIPVLGGCVPKGVSP